MKYAILYEYREHLRKVLDNKHTADTYYYSLKRLFKDMDFNNVSDIPRERYEELLLRTNTRGEYQKAKCALKYLKSFNHKTNIPTEEFFRETAKEKCKKGMCSVRPAKTIEHDTISRKVNAIRDKKLKTAFRLMEKSGLRVSEAAALQKRDIEIDGDIIKIDVRHSKGGSNDIVTAMPDAWLAGKLAALIEPLDPETRPFYATQTMKNKACKLGIECHDFRRIAAITHRDRRRAEGDELPEANEATKDFLRHTRFSVTKRYLRNRKLKYIKRRIK